MGCMNDRLFLVIDIHRSLTGTELANKTAKTDGKSFNDLKLVGEDTAVLQHYDNCNMEQ